MKYQDYNRNLIGGKRRHRGFQKCKNTNSLSERLILESKALEDYFKRINKK
jgi:hypothetical protein